MPPLNIFGMTESAGAVTTWTHSKVKAYTCGSPLPGVDIKLDKTDKDGQGEICMRGRNIFMGYYKNAKTT